MFMKISSSFILKVSASSETYLRGLAYYNQKRVKITYNQNLNSGKKVVEFTVKNEKNKEYYCRLSFDLVKNNMTSFHCTCPAHGQYHGCCKHVIATLTCLSEEGEDENYTDSDVLSYINTTLNHSIIKIDSEKDVTIIPYLQYKLSGRYREVYFEFKIGKNRFYKIQNIGDFIYNIHNKEDKEYGKNFSLNHSIESFDAIGKGLVKFIFANYRGSDSEYSRYSERKIINVRKYTLDSFFEHYIGDELIINNRPHKIVKGNPWFTLLMEKTKDDIIRISLDEFYHEYYTLPYGEEIYYVGEGKIYCCEKEFTQFAGGFMEILTYKEKKTVNILESDMPVFYTNVLNKLRKYVTLKTDIDLSIYEDIQLASKLYLDYENGIVTGELKFYYGENEEKAFGEKDLSRNFDLSSEMEIENAVSKYFEYDKLEEKLILADEDDIYEFLTKGIGDLSQYVEVFATDKFNSLKIYPSVKINIGVKLESDLLEMDIDLEDFSINELIEALKSYKKGKKYHKIKGGSFLDLEDESFKEFSELVMELNISDKELLKEKVKIPIYRMLYLDHIINQDSRLNFQRNKEFKKVMRNFKDVSGNDFPLPEQIESKLRNYQKEGFFWLKTISEYSLGGILADDMGLGKTIQAITLMLSAKNSDIKAPSLVVSPSSLTLNWESEIKKFAPELNTMTVIGVSAAREEMIKSINSDVDVVITSYDLLKRDIVNYSDKEFYYQFIDEAQFIKNHSTQSSKAVKVINSKVKFALTGTPVENSLAELWSIYDYIMPGYLFNYNHFKKTYESPIVKSNDEEAVRSLKRLCTPFILRRMKKDVLKELPEKTETIVYSMMEEEQKKLYTANLLKMKKDLAEKMAQSTGENKLEVLAMLTKLRQLCCDPSLVYDDYKGGSAKLETCLELLENCINSGHKILLFSQFTSMLALIENKLIEKNISYYKLTGSTKSDERIKLVNKFNQNNTSVFLISLKAGGTGLNLVGADIVIHYDPWWNISAQNQATDRVHRIGQKNSVQVFKIIAKNTIEEKILKLQETKAELADMIVKDGDGSITKMSIQELSNIFD